MRFLTNFDKEMRPVYEAAIAEYGDPAFVIHDAPSVDGISHAGTLFWMQESMNSLWCENDAPFDTGDFWRVFEKLKEAKVAPSPAEVCDNEWHRDAKTSACSGCGMSVADVMPSPAETVASQGPRPCRECGGHDTHFLSCEFNLATLAEYNSGMETPVYNDQRAVPSVSEPQPLDSRYDEPSEISESRLARMDLIGSLVNLYHVIEGRDCPRHLALGMATIAVSKLKRERDSNQETIKALEARIATLEAALKAIRTVAQPIIRDPESVNPFASWAAQQADIALAEPKAETGE